MDNKAKLLEFHQLLCDVLNKEGIKDEYKDELYDWVIDKDDPYITFLGGIYENDRAYNYLLKNGYFSRRVCPSCGDFPIENRYTFRSTLSPEKNFYICKNCYEEGIKYSNQKSVKKSGCYIATACYKDPNSDEICILKRFRDEELCKNIIGKLSIKLYYFLSPPIARWLSNKKLVNDFIRYFILDKIVKKLTIKYSQH